MILTFLALAAAGCGGGPRLERAKLMQRADAICSSATASMQAVTKPRNTASLRQVANYLVQLSRVANRRYDQLNSLKPSGAASPYWNGFLNAEKVGARVLHTIATAPISDHAAAKLRLELFRRVNRDVGTGATDYQGKSAPTIDSFYPPACRSG